MCGSYLDALLLSHLAEVSAMNSAIFSPNSLTFSRAKHLEGNAEEVFVDDPS